jgi:4'-phosphopantetheinyl transferase
MPIPLTAVTGVESGFGTLARAAGDTVDLWLIRLDADPGVVQAAASVLSDPERARAARFQFHRHRHLFMAAHGALRRLLGTYTASHPRALTFDTEASGRPYLVGDEPQLEFSLAHSDELLVIAVTRCGRVGVDIERLTAVRDGDRWGCDVLSPAEARMLNDSESDEHRRLRSLLAVWTRKEAMLKATGDGLAHDLRDIDSSASDFACAVVKEIPTLAGVASVTVRSFDGPGYVGAVALSGRHASLPVAWGSLLS